MIKSEFMVPKTWLKHYHKLQNIPSLLLQKMCLFMLVYISTNIHRYTTLIPSSIPEAHVPENRNKCTRFIIIVNLGKQLTLTKLFELQFN
jgi:hypothetical protein